MHKYDAYMSVLQSQRPAATALADGYDHEPAGSPDKILQNVAANTEAMFDAAQAIAKAGSVPEAMKLQGQFLQQLVATSSTQAKEFYDLSTRATQHLVETVQAAAGKSIKTGF
jgi:phasin family protein